MEKTKEWFKRNKIVIFIASLGLLTIAAPFIFTRKEFLGIVFDVNTGPIGDTIGGITAPFLGFLSIILLYITLKRQVDFNDKQDKFNEQQINFNNKQIEINEEQLNLIKKQDERDSVNSDFALIFNLQKQINNLFENITIDGRDKGKWLLSLHTKTRKKISHIDLLTLLINLRTIMMSTISLFDNIHNSSIPKQSKIILFAKAKNDIFVIEQFFENILNKNIPIVNEDLTIDDNKMHDKLFQESMDSISEALETMKKVLKKYEDY